MAAVTLGQSQAPSTPEASAKSAPSKKDTIGSRLEGLNSGVQLHIASLKEKIAEYEADKKRFAEKISQINPELLKEVDGSIAPRKLKLIPYLSMLHLICIKVRSFFYRYFGSFQLDKANYLNLKDKHNLLIEQITKSCEVHESINALKDAKAKDDALVKVSTGAYAARLGGLEEQVQKLQGKLTEREKKLREMNTDLDKALKGFGASRFIVGYEALVGHCRSAQELLEALPDASASLTGAVILRRSSATGGGSIAPMGSDHDLPRSGGAAGVSLGTPSELALDSISGAPKLEVSDIEEADALRLADSGPVGLGASAEGLLSHGSAKASAGGGLVEADRLDEEVVLVPDAAGPPLDGLDEEASKPNMNQAFLNYLIEMRPDFRQASANFVFRNFLPKMKSFNKLDSGAIQLEFEKETRLELDLTALTQGYIKKTITITLPTIVEFNLDSREPKITFVEGRGMSASKIVMGLMNVTPKMNGLGFTGEELQFDIKAGFSTKQSLSIAFLEGKAFA